MGINKLKESFDLKSLPSMVRNEFAKLPAKDQEAFIEEYERKKKYLGSAYVCWLLLGCHYAYVRKWGLQILFWLTCGGLFLWWAINIFQIPKMIGDYNKGLAISVLKDIKVISR